MNTTGRKSNSIAWIMVACLGWIVLSCGCDNRPKTPTAPDDDSSAVKAASSRPLKVLAIACPNFDGEVIRQWAAQRDGELSVQRMTLSEFGELGGESGKLDLPTKPDLILFPAAVTAELHAAEVLREIPKSVTSDETFNRKGILRHFSKSFVRHANSIRSVSLGGTGPVFLYRKDILEKTGTRLPRTWEEFSLLIKKVEQQKKDITGLESVFLMPTSESWPARTFLARSAASVRARGKLTTVFDRKTMVPLIAETPFEQAIVDVKKLAQESLAKSEALSPEDVFQEFADGKAAFAFTIPRISEPLSESAIENSANWGVMPLPGAKRFYDMKEKQWQRRRSDEKLAVSSIDYDVFNIAVCSRCSKPQDAFEFILWLTEKRMSSRILPPISGPFRAAHFGQLERWLNLEDADRAFLDELSDYYVESHQERVVFLFPHILRRTEYLKSLNVAVTEFLAAENSDAKKALTEVSSAWEKISQQVGRENQIKALSGTSGL